MAGDASGRNLRELATVLGFRDFRRVWIAQVLSELGDWAARVALAVLVFDRTGSAALSGIVTATSLVPWIGIGQALATLGDKLPRRWVMVVADLVRAGCFIAMLTPLPLWAIIAVAFLAGMAGPPFETARAALLPDVVPKERYGDAVGITHLTFQAVLMLGYIAGGGLVAAFGAKIALGINGLTFLASALVLIPLSVGRTRPSSERPATHTLMEAVRFILRDRLLLRAVLLAGLTGAFAITGEALVAVYMRQEIGGTDIVIGLLAATVPLGTIVAAVFVPRKGDHRSMLRSAAVLGAIASSVGAVSFLMRPKLPFAIIPFLAIGAVFAVIIPANSVGGARLPDEFRASAFGLIQGLVTGGQALGVFIGSALAGMFGAAVASGLMLVPGVVYSIYASIHVPEMRTGQMPIPGGQDERRTPLISNR